MKWNIPAFELIHVYRTVPENKLMTIHDADFSIGNDNNKTITIDKQMIDPCSYG